MPLRYLEDWKVGLVRRSGEELVTREEIVGFASEWDPQPFHVDEELAAQSIYGGLTACTAHIFAIVSRLTARMEDRDAALAGLGIDEMRLHRPLRAGDRVHYESECTAVRRSETKPDRGIVDSHCKLFNQRGELVFSMRARMMIASRTHGEQADARQASSAGSQ